MRRASKILTLILIVVFLFGIFAGCDLVGKDTAKYRAAVAMTVGNQKITVGKLLDTFNSYYSSYYYYISYGYFTVEDVLEIAVNSLITQYMKVDTYTADQSNVKVASNKGTYAHAEYLTQEQLDYSISYVKYLMLTSFDSTVMEKVEDRYELNDEEAEDTSRDFYEFDDLKGAATYSEYYLNQNFTNEDMDEYIEKYYGGDNAGFLSSKDLLALYQESAEIRVEELNERIDEDNDKIELDDFKDIQKTVVKQYENTVKNSYAISFDVFVKQQIEDMINSSIVNLYNYSVYSEIEKDTEEMYKLLQENFDTLKKAQEAQFAINKNYETFVESLSSSSTIYNVPADYEGQYVFVKNILIPFSAQQSAWLTSFENDIGTDEDERYIKFRNFLASQIEADDFNSEKDEDGKYEKIADLFKFEDGKVSINSECTDLSAFLNADGSVVGETQADKDATIRDLMARFNTDTAQHSALYSYVVRVGDVPETYKHRWVQEFVDATNDAMKNGGVGYYGIGVSDYGVHIVYVEGYVEAVGEVNFAANYLDTSTVEYRLFTTYFSTQREKLVSEDLEELRKSYVDSNKINETNVFKKFLKENGIDFDLAAILSDDED